MGPTAQFKLRTVFTTLTAWGAILAFLVSCGAAAGMAVVFILMGGVAIHFVAVVLTDVLDLAADLARRKLLRGREDALTGYVVEDEKYSSGVECVVATWENVELDYPNHSVRFLIHPVNDDDLEDLTKLSDLRWLVLDNTHVSDTGLTLLHGLRRLRRVYLRGSQVTTEGVQRLKLALPELEVVY